MRGIHQPPMSFMCQGRWSKKGADDAMSKLHLLVVDDEWNMRNLLRIYLSKYGFQVTEEKGSESL
jgi:response regulator RpfG family c-di-GMP phosphodiesterase